MKEIMIALKLPKILVRMSILFSCIVSPSLTLAAEPCNSSYSELSELLTSGQTTPPSKGLIRKIKRRLRSFKQFNCMAADGSERSLLWDTLTQNYDPYSDYVQRRFGPFRDPLVRLLLESGAKPYGLLNRRDFYHLGLSQDLIETLVQHNYPVNETDASGVSVLSHAVLTNNLKLVRLLIARGALATVLDQAGCGPLHQLGLSNFNNNTRENDSLEIAQLLLEHGASDQLNSFCEMTSFVYHGMKTHLSPLFGILSNFKKSVTLPVVQLFIKYGADLNLKNKEGSTSLHYLLSQHNNISSGWAYDDARRIDANNQERDAVTDLLIRSGADLDVPNDQGLRPANLATRSNDLIKMVNAGAKIFFSLQELKQWRDRISLETGYSNNSGGWEQVPGQLFQGSIVLERSMQISGGGHAIFTPTIISFDQQLNVTSIESVEAPCGKNHLANVVQLLGQWKNGYVLYCGGADPIGPSVEITITQGNRPSHSSPDMARFFREIILVDQHFNKVKTVFSKQYDGGAHGYLSTIQLRTDTKISHPQDPERYFKNPVTDSEVVIQVRNPTKEQESFDVLWDGTFSSPKITAQ